MDGVTGLRAIAVACVILLAYREFAARIKRDCDCGGSRPKRNHAVRRNRGCVSVACAGIYRRSKQRAAPPARHPTSITASAANAPSPSAIANTGLRSIARSRGPAATAKADSRASIDASAATSAFARPRAPSSSGSRGSNGSSPPPRPPRTGSGGTPRPAALPRTHRPGRTSPPARTPGPGGCRGCIRCRRAVASRPGHPRSALPARASRARCSRVAKPARTAAASATSSNTPPISDLCRMSERKDFQHHRIAEPFCRGHGGFGRGAGGFGGAGDAGGGQEAASPPPRTASPRAASSAAPWGPGLPAVWRRRHRSGPSRRSRSPRGRDLRGRPSLRLPARARRPPGRSPTARTAGRGISRAPRSASPASPASGGTRRPW